MTSKKSRVLMSLGTTVLVLSLITSSMVGGTFAKYTSTVAGNDSARVAKFAFTVTDQNDKALTKKTDNTTIDLFTTVLDSGVYASSGANKNGADKLVAPGVQGSFGLKVQNTSEVMVKANLTITEKAADGVAANTVPIIYAYTADNQTTFWSDVIPTGTKNILLHELDGTISDISTIMDVASVETADAQTFTDAQAGKKTVTIKGDLKALAAEINKSAGARLPATNGTTPSELNLSNNFKWFWAYEIYTSKEDPADASKTIWVPDVRDGLDTAMVWDEPNNKAQTNIPGIKLNLEVQITQMDKAPTPAP